MNRAWVFPHKRQVTHASQAQTWCQQLNDPVSIDTSDSGPLRDDCVIIEEVLEQAGFDDYWTLTPDKFNNAPGGWWNAASQGTCAFQLRLDDISHQSDAVRFGYNDVKNLIDRWIVPNGSKHISAQGPTACADDAHLDVNVHLQWRTVSTRSIEFVTSTLP